MSMFSSSFSFAAPSSRPDHLYTFDSVSDSISPTSSRAGSPSSPTTTAASSADSSTDDLFALTSHLSASSLYPSNHRLPAAALSCRRSPPRSTPFTLPPSTAAAAQANPDILARRERRQAYVQDQLSTQSRRKLSLLVSRMLGDDPSFSGARKHPSDGLHPSNVRVVPAMPGSARGSRRNTLAEVKSDEDGEDGRGMDVDGDGVGRDLVESIENGETMWGQSRERDGANRISKRRSGERGRKSIARGKK